MRGFPDSLAETAVGVGVGVGDSVCVGDGGAVVVGSTVSVTGGCGVAKAWRVAVTWETIWDGWAGSAQLVMSKAKRKRMLQKVIFNF